MDIFWALSPTIALGEERLANFRSALPSPSPAIPPPRCLNHIKVKGGKEGEGDLEEGGFRWDEQEGREKMEPRGEYPKAPPPPPLFGQISLEGGGKVAGSAPPPFWRGGDFMRKPSSSFYSFLLWLVAR